MKWLIFSLFFLNLTTFCSKKENFGSSDEEKKKICKQITKNAKLEIAAPVQRPSLKTVPTKSSNYKDIHFQSDSNIVGGINIKSFQKLGVFKLLNKTLLNWYQIEAGLNLLELYPGDSLENIFYSFKFPKNSIIPNSGSIEAMGNFSAQKVFSKLKVLAKSGRANIPFNVRNDQISMVFDKNKYILKSRGKNIISAFSTVGKKNSDLRNNKIFQAMSKNIPYNTSFWFILMNPPVLTSGVPKILKKSLAQLQYISGYLNIDSAKNVEVQIRIRFSKIDTAISSKELLKLFISRTLNKLGPIINKSFNLDNSHIKSIVLRGSLIRILFKLDRFQTQHILRLLRKYLRENSNMIPSLTWENKKINTPVDDKKGVNDKSKLPKVINKLPEAVMNK